MKQILIIGGGSIGERHLRCFLRTGRAEVALCDVNESLRSGVAARYNVAQTFASLSDALKATFDAAVICTPAHLHIPMAIDIARQNMGILIEKPLSTSLDHIDELQKETEARGLSVSVAYVLRHHPALVAVRQCVLSGTYGRPVQIVFTGGQHFPFYRPAYRDTYYTRHATGGGAIQDALTHIVNAAEWIVGPVTRLVADAEHFLLDGVDVEDTVHLITRHDTIMGAFSLNQHQAPNETTLTVICERGTVRYEAHAARWLTCTEPNSAWKVEEEFRIERDDMFLNQAHAFLDQLDGKAAPACSLSEARQTLFVNLAELKSIESGSWIRL
ncbi:MAG: Gfo/Idh/MocA family oxidoreductase [Planctomycetaceae bacterium]|nr:Gfo/Idh/MocA family oxidoreductase [Planctomycetaceae bacterium]